MSIVLVTDYIKNPDIERHCLMNTSDVVTMNDTFNPEDVTSILVWHIDINLSFLKKYPNVKFIQRYGVGFDNIDLELCKKMSITFCNNPDYGVDEVSDTALAKILYLTRGLGKYLKISKDLMHQQTIWQERVAPELKRLNQQNLLVIGAGRIGTALILKAKNLFATTTFYDPYVASGYEKSLQCSRSLDLMSAVQEADVISLNCNLNASTRGIVNEQFIENCRSNVLIINTARGGLFESDELILGALEDEKIGGLATDVLNNEPPTENVSEIITKIYDDGNRELLITNHTSYFSKQSIVEMRKNAAKNVLRFLKCGNCLNRVD